MYQPWLADDDDDDDNDCGASGGMNEWQGKPKYSEETCPSAALSTADPTHHLPGGEFPLLAS
jgi:hypothetical protein